MFSVQITNPQVFARKARTLKTVVTLVRGMTVLPKIEEDGVRMVPVQNWDFSLEFVDPHTGEVRWSFREVTEPAASKCKTLALFRGVKVKRISRL